MVQEGNAGNVRSRCATSHNFGHFFAGLTDRAIAAFGENGLVHVFSTVGEVSLDFLDRTEFANLPKWKPDGSPEPKCVSRIERLELCESQLREYPTSDCDSTALDWQVYSLTLSDGSVDRLAMALPSEIEADLTRNFISRVWPMLRDECLRSADEAAGSFQGSEWSLIDCMDTAVLIFDRHGLVYRQNRAAANMLERGCLLKRSRNGIIAGSARDTDRLRKALHELSLVTPSNGSSSVIFLSRPEDARRVPVTLSHYFHDGKPTRFLVATIPVKPSVERVEALARNLGLTHTESRVAALIQLGYTNREAAEIAGIKEQTFNTYSKRILSKLRVRGRVELAQVLTWQSIGGGA